MTPTAAERELADRLGFEPDVCELVKATGRATLTPFGPADEPAVAVAYRVADGNDAERQIAALQPQLVARGYRAFWTSLHEPNGLRIGNAVAVLRATDSFAMLDAARPDGWNYDLSPDAVRHHIRGWTAVGDFDVVGASRDRVAIVFRSLPADLCAFVEDVYLFCSDVFEPAMGERNRAEAAAREAAARQLCPRLSRAFWAAHDAKFASVFDDGSELAEFRADLRRDTLRSVQLFAHRLAETKYLHLWWD